MKTCQRLLRGLFIVLLGTLLPVILVAAVKSSGPTPIVATLSGVEDAASVQPAAPVPPGETNALNPNPPDEVVKLVFIRHSCGENWLGNGNGNLGTALGTNNYYVSDTYYNWGPDSIGSYTDIGHWWLWFRGPNSSTYLDALYHTTTRYADYTRPMADPGGENEIIMFKSCFPNSNLQGHPNDPPTAGNNPLRGQSAGTSAHTVGNAKGIYNDLLEYFETRQDKLFVVITAPPVLDATYAANARAFNNWLVNDWLADYTYHNVVVFDFYNVLTTNGGNADTNDLGWSTGNHHRVVTSTTPITIEHTTDGDDDVNPNVLEYPSWGTNDHPNTAGNRKGTGEFIPLLNVYYSCWKHGDCGVSVLSPRVYLPIVVKQSPADQSSRLVPTAVNHFSFGSPVEIVALGDDVQILLPVDLDRDGRVDVAYGNGPALQIARNTVGLGGTWNITRNVGTAAGEIMGLATGDLNRDGHPDLVTAAGTEVRLWGNPGAAFGKAWVAGTTLTMPPGVHQSTVTVTDLDRDGAVDVVAGGADGVVRLWRNPLALQGDLTDTWSTAKELPALGGAIAAVETGDLDRDGRPDLIVVGDGANPTIRLWRNPGAAFSADWVESVDLAGADGLALPAGQRLVVADLDGDNHLDVVVGDEGGTLHAWRNPGTTPFAGGWGAGVVLGSVEGDLSSIASADLDNDAAMELAGVGGDTPAQIVAWESGVEPFGAAWTMSLIGVDNDPLVSMWPADLDHDGDLDVVTGGQGRIGAWPNQLAPWAVGFEGVEHTVGFNDTWTTALIVADLDSDGYPDLATGELDGRITAWHNDGTPFDAGWTGHRVGVATDWWELLALAGGDLDNDGDLDLVTGYYYDYGPVIWENDGNPFEGDWVRRQVGSQRVGALELADVNGDGRLDIVTGGGLPWGDTPGEENRVTVWYAPAVPFSDTWQATDVGLAYYSVLGLAVGDLDNDGDNDIVIGTYHAPPIGSVEHPLPPDQWPDVYQIRAFRNDGGDHWTEFNVGRDPEIETLGIAYHGFWGATVTHIALADLDNDGDLDIVASERVEGDFLVMGWQNDGTPLSGELWVPSAVAKGERYNWLEASVFWVEPGDFDRDGDLDLVAGSGKEEPHQVMAWENSGVAFGAVISETAWVRHNVGALGEETQTGGVADFDRDGDLDLVASSFASASNEIRLWENYVVPDLALGIAPVSRAVAPGHAVTYTAVVTGLYGFDQPVNLWVSGLPPGIEVAWSCDSVLPPASSVLTLTPSLDSLPGDYMLLTVAMGGGTIRTAPFTLTIMEQTCHVYLPVVLQAR